jgi:hypothetical protein
MSEVSFVSVCRVYFVSLDKVLLWIYEVLYTISERWFTIDYLCLLFLGDDVKLWHLRITR